jgi:hypothetical protein
VFFLGFAVVWTVVASAGVLRTHFAAKSALSNGSAQVVEGVATNFHPEPAAGHDPERFTVNGVRFSYSYYVLGQGFNQSSSHGGPIREGLQVRIHYVDASTGNNILKLEVGS